MKKLAIIAIVIMVALVAGRYAFGQFGQMQRAQMMKAMMVPKVKLATIGEAEIINTVEAPGRVEALNNVDIIARISGRLERQYFQEGSYVKKGELLMLIEPQEYSAAVARAQAGLQSALAQANKAEKDYLRAKELVERDYIPKSSYDATLASRNVATANVASARTVLNDAQRNLSYTRVSAPISGRIGKIFITQGNFVTPQSGPLANIVSVDPILVSYSLDSKQFSLLRDEILPSKDAPIKVELILPNGSTYKHLGKQDFWGNQISQSTGTIDLRATFQNDEGALIPGDFVKVKVYSNTVTKRTVAPQSAVLQDAAGRYVFMVDENGAAKQVRVETDGEDGADWIIASGLKPGDKIINQGAMKVMNGVAVKILNDEEYAEFEKQEGQESK
jgi:membrane fusion protein (multidrug efflux system)